MIGLAHRTAVAATILVAAPASSQDFATSIHDLVAVPVPLGTPDWLHRFGADGSESAFGTPSGLRSEAAFLRFGGDPLEAPFSPEGLAEFLDLFAGIGGGLSVSGQTLYAPAHAADQVELALRWLRARTLTGISYQLLLERIDGETREVLLSGTQDAHAAVPAILADLSRRSRLWTYSVEIAAGSSLATPCVAEQQSGAAIAVRARPFADGDLALVQMLARVIEPHRDARIELGHAGFGDLDRVGAHFAEAAVAFVIPRGGRAVHEWTDGSGRTLRLSCRPVWGWPAAPRTGAAVVNRSMLGGESVLDFSALDGWQRALFSDGNPDPRELRFGEAVWEGFERAEIYDSLRMIDSQDTAGLVAINGVNAAEAAAEVNRQLEAAMPRVEFEFGVFTAPVGVPVTIRGALGDGVECLVRGSGLAVAGLTTCWTGGDERSYLRSWQSEVASNSRIPQPLVESLTTGYAVDLRVAVGRDRRPQAVSLACELERYDGLESREVAISQAVLSPAHSYGSASVPKGSQSGSVHLTEVQPTALPADVVVVEQPKTRAHRIAVTLQLGPDGTAEARRRARSFLGVDREIVVLVRAVPRD